MQNPSWAVRLSRVPSVSPDFESLLQHLASIHPLPAGGRERMASLLNVRDLAKGEYFVRAGETPTRVGFMVSGWLQYFYVDADGRRFVRYFCCAGNFVSSLSAMMDGTASAYSIQAVEASRLVVFPYQLLAFASRDGCRLGVHPSDHPGAGSGARRAAGEVSRLGRRGHALQAVPRGSTRGRAAHQAAGHRQLSRRQPRHAEPHPRREGQAEISIGQCVRSSRAPSSSQEDAMRVITVSEAGTARAEEAPGPPVEIGPGQVRVRVRYAGIGFADVMAVQGRYPLAPRRPFSPGYEFMGQVVGGALASWCAGGRRPAPDGRLSRDRRCRPAASWRWCPMVSPTTRPPLCPSTT